MPGNAKKSTVPDDGEPDLPIPPMEEDEVADLLDNLPRRNVIGLRNRPHLELLYGAALRVTESVNLDVKDLSLSRRTVYVKKGKNVRDRTIPMMRGVQGR